MIKADRGNTIKYVSHSAKWIKQGFENHGSVS